MVDFVSKGALLISTDSVILPQGTDIACHSLDLLKTVDSDMPVELEADAGIIFRTRLYAELLKGTSVDRLPQGKEPLAVDEDWAVIKMARHGVPIEKEDCARAVLASLKAERSVPVGAKKITLLGAEAAIRAGLPINYPKVDEREPQFSWDHKRILLNPDVNPWRSYTHTEPYTSLGRLEEAERRKLVERERRLQLRRDNAKAVHDQVINLLAERCHSVREIAKLTGASKSTVQRLKDATKWSEMDDYKRSKRILSVSVPVDSARSTTAEPCPTPSSDAESNDQTAQESGADGGNDVSPDPSQNAKTGTGG
jgi:chorismate mutase